jgi:predicted  nucleic acid-binding Zn-ribbon protein
MSSASRRASPWARPGLLTLGTALVVLTLPLRSLSAQEPGKDKGHRLEPSPQEEPHGTAMNAFIESGLRAISSEWDSFKEAFNAASASPSQLPYDAYSAQPARRQGLGEVPQSSNLEALEKKRFDELGERYSLLSRDREEMIGAYASNVEALRHLLSAPEAAQGGERTRLRSEVSGVKGDLLRILSRWDTVEREFMAVSRALIPLREVVSLRGERDRLRKQKASKAAEVDRLQGERKLRRWEFLQASKTLRRLQDLTAIITGEVGAMAADRSGTLDSKRRPVPDPVLAQEVEKRKIAARDNLKKVGERLAQLEVDVLEIDDEIMGVRARLEAAESAGDALDPIGRTPKKGVPEPGGPKDVQ